MNQEKLLYVESLQTQPVGSTIITSSPPEAAIYIDDAFTNSVTPTAIIDIPVGWHIYTLTKPGFISVSGIFSIEEGQVTPIIESLPAIPSSNLFTTILGLAAITGLSTIVSIYIQNRFFGQRRSSMSSTASKSSNA